MNTQYEDIITLPHPTSASHPRMSRRNRAAQFAPFAALTGYDAAIQETGRSTEPERELDEDKCSMLNHQLQFLESQLNRHPSVTITYFVPDHAKAGGSYLHLTDAIHSIDRRQHRIITENGTQIPMGHIIELEFSLQTEVN